MTMTVSSTAFADGGVIPRRHTCDGEDLSPPMSFADVPSGTKELALLVEDPDAPGGTFVHWLIWDLPARARALREGMAKARHLDDGAKQGINGYGTIGWSGPTQASDTAEMQSSSVTVHILWLGGHSTGLRPVPAYQRGRRSDYAYRP